LLPRKEINKAEYDKDIDNYLEVISKSSVILSKKFTRNAEYIAWIHIGILHYDIKYEMKNVSKFRYFIYDLKEIIDNFSREELFKKIEDKNRFQFEQWAIEKTDKEGAVAFLEANFTRWKKWIQTKNR